MKKTIFSILFVTILQCIPALHNKDDIEIINTQLGIEDSKRFDNIIELGKELARYDLNCAKASDELIKRIGSERMRQKQLYYIFLKKEKEEAVYFGNLTNNIYNINYKVVFSGETANLFSFSTPLQVAPLTKLACAFRKAVEYNNSYLITSKLPYNFWCIQKNDSVVVYLSPGGNNDFIYVCGGIKTIINAKNDVIENKHMHKSPLKYEMKGNWDSFIRSSSQDTIPNEIDIAQSIINFKYLPRQEIFCNKYFYSLSFVNNDIFTPKIEIFKSVLKQSNPTTEKQ